MRLDAARSPAAAGGDGLDAAGVRDTVATRVLDAAYELYLERGLRETTLSAVAQRAGVSRPTVYKHVGDVAAVSGAVVARELERFFAEVARLLDAAEPAVAATGPHDGSRAGVGPHDGSCVTADSGTSVAGDVGVVERVAAALGFAIRHARQHPLLQRLLALEPDAILPVFTVDAAPVLRRAVALLAPALAPGAGVASHGGADVPAAAGEPPHRDPDAVAHRSLRRTDGATGPPLQDPAAAAELLVRLTISFVVTPPLTPELVEDTSLRRLVAAVLGGARDP
jgi:AcrR family transcriptional regulator